jgi:hypothetical protein
MIATETKVITEKGCIEVFGMGRTILNSKSTTKETGGSRPPVEVVKG